jgi:trigger factor
MKVTQERLENSQIALEIEVPAETTQNTYNTVVQNLARSSNIPGFRKGKVPRQILFQRLGVERIKAAVLEELIQNSVDEAVKQESLTALGNYQLRTKFEELIENYQPGQSLIFSASFDVPPEVKIENYTGLNIKAEEVVYKPEEVDSLLTEYQEKKSILVPVEDRPAQMGDVIVIDYEGRFVGTEGQQDDLIEGASAKDFQIEMAAGKLIEGLLEGVVGMNIDETRDISATFPENYANTNLAGKAAVFTITLRDIKEKELPELDDEFAAEVSEYQTMQELRESLEKQYQEKAADATRSNIYAAIINELVKLGNFDLPDSMIQKEVDTLITQSAMQLQRMGIDIKNLLNADTIPAMREKSKPEAIDNLKSSLIIAEIAKRESLEVNQEKLQEKIRDLQEQFAEQNFDPTRLEEFVKEDLIKETTLEWLEERSNLELVPEGSLKEEDETSETVDNQE